MSNVFVATLGKRPEAITVALDLLADRYSFEAVSILHTEPIHSGIAEALTTLHQVFATDYPGLRLAWHEITSVKGTPLLDIINRETAEDYFRGVYTALHEWHDQGYTIHLLIAGGRKAMSTYATLAAGLLFTVRDRVWTVLSPDEMLEQGGVFHIPPGMRDRVQLVDLPLLPANFSAEERARLDEDPLALLAERRDIRRLFLETLSTEEKRLADLIAQQPAATNQDYAEILHKSPRTIENQYAALYAKLGEFIPEVQTSSHKRMILVDVLTGRQ